MLGGVGAASAEDWVTMEDQQELQYIESRLSDIIICNDALSHTTNRLTELYRSYTSYIVGNLSGHSKDEVYYDPIKSALLQKAEDIAYTKRKAESLLARTRSSKGLVSKATEYFVVR